MRSYIPSYELRVPGNFAEALAMAPEWKPLAGGTDIMVLFEAGKLAYRKYMDIHRLPELRGITVAETHVTLGALTTYTEVRRHPVLQAEFPMLCQAARETGGVAIQNRGTLGGNIVNASPAADSCPALLAYDAELHLESAAGARVVEYAKFHTGYKQMDLRPGELLRGIRVARATRGARHYYRKVGTRKAQAISKVCFAGLAHADGRVRIALGSVAPTVIRCYRTEAAFRRGLAAAQEALAAEIAPIDDIRSTAKYRRQVALNLLAEFFAQVE